MAHDPIAMERARTEWKELQYYEAESAEQAAMGADAIVIATEWVQYSHLNWTKVASSMRNPLIVDTCNLIQEHVPNIIV